MEASQYKKPIITIKEARKILAEEASGMSDEQIRQLVLNIEKLAEHSLRKALVR